MNGLLLRALLAFLALPGMVAFAVPLLVLAPGGRSRWVEPWGALPLGLGIVILILAGWAIGMRSWPLAIYAACVAVAVQVRVLVHEEPFLARTHPDAWTAYRARVGRWVGW